MVDKVASHGCVVQRATEEIYKNSASLRTAMRNLRHDLMDCLSCGRYEGCPILQNFKTNVSTAINEITEEWKLASVDDA